MVISPLFQFCLNFSPSCKEVLQNLFGLSTDVLQDTFFHRDENMDKVISRKEGHAASQSLERSNNPVNTVKDTVNTVIKNFF